MFTPPVVSKFVSSDQLSLPGEDGRTGGIHGAGKPCVQGHLHSIQVGQGRAETTNVSRSRASNISQS